jgi:hypothetical protein
MRTPLATILIATLSLPASAAVTSTTLHGPDSTSLDSLIAVGDALSGLIATELPGDHGWHGANDNPADQLPAFTDDAGILGSGLTGLLNDFPPADAPAKKIQYDLAGPTSIGAIQILTGNNGRDGRVFSTFTIETSIDNGNSFSPLGYFQSDPSGTINNGQWGSTLVTVFDSAFPILAAGVTNLRFDLYAVDNTGNQMRDPFDGVNPFTGVDDGLTAAFVSPLVFEIDVIAIPEPGSLTLLACAAAALTSSYRRRR